MSREDLPMKWQDPCGPSTSNNGGDVGTTSDAELIKQIVNQAHIAETKARRFSEEFVRKAFNEADFNQHDSQYAGRDYPWLHMEEIPKKMGQNVSEDHLNSLEFKSALRNVYPILQTIAVGLEQMVWDEEDKDGPFREGFVSAEGHLRTLLCELHTAILDRGVQVDNVNREVMDLSLRKLDNTSQNLRNWIIFRDYINMLEYVIQVFSHLKENPTD